MQNLSLEIIQYQNKDDFPTKLTSILEEVYNEIDSKVYKTNRELLSKSSQMSKITSLIKDRFNMNVVFDKEINEYIPAAIIPFLSDYMVESSFFNKISPATFGNIFSGTNIFKYIKQIEKEREEYFKKIDKRKGYVDLKNARVGGYLSEVKHYLIVNFFSNKEDDITPSELCAIVLHELGHAFVGLETHHRLTTTNSTILDVLDNINKNNPDKAKYIFNRHFKQEDLEKASLGNEETINDFYSKIATTYLKELNSQLINGKYDETNYENLADSFATRFNKGSDLVIGLEKLHRKYGLTFPNSRLLYASMMFVSITTVVVFLALTGVIGAIVAAVVLITFLGADSSDMTYDFPLDRYNRIRNSIVNNLKNTRLPNKLIEDLLTQYNYITKIIETSMEFKGILQLIPEYIFPSNVEKNYYIHLQKTIENNLNNSLFVKSASLKVAA